LGFPGDLRGPLPGLRRGVSQLVEHVGEPGLEKNGVPVGGGDQVASTEMVDLHVSYDFDLLGGAQVFLDVTNLFNRDPVFYNSANGYDQYTGDVLGRVSTLGIRVKLK
jgi:outer membrane receptor protein involved in Fe transport